MIITDSAKEILLKMMKDENKGGLSVDIIRTGCHGQLSIDFIDFEECEININGIAAKMTDEAAQALENVTLTERNGTLVFQVGCGGGCHSNCHSSSEDGCCGGCCDNDEEGCNGGCNCH